MAVMWFCAVSRSDPTSLPYIAHDRRFYFLCSLNSLPIKLLILVSNGFVPIIANGRIIHPIIRAPPKIANTNQTRTPTFNQMFTILSYQELLGNKTIPKVGDFFPSKGGHMWFGSVTNT